MRNLLPAQCRAARGMLDWTQEELACAAGVSRSTVRDFEGGRHELHHATEAQLVRAFEAAGIRFIADPNEPGLLLRRGLVKIQENQPGRSGEVTEAPRSRDHA